MDISRTSAERRAFEDYLRWGRAPDVRAHHRKQAARALSVKALGDARPTSYYTWRTAHDERVRPSHGANEGQVFAWSAPPATGHPGNEPNCRCVAEAYYGTPFVSDTTLPLKRNQRIDATGEAVWQSIDTLTRPDGSLAQSAIVMRDGTTIRSTFNGGLVVNNVTLPDGRVVRVERRDGVQSVFIGDSTMPLVQSVWTANGPRVAVPTTRVAFSGSPLDLLPRRIEVDDVPFRPWRSGFEEIDLLHPNSKLTPDLSAGGAAIGLALLALFRASEADKESVGAGVEDKPALTIRIWTPEGKLTPVPVNVTSLTAEQVAQNCKRLPEVQLWTDRAAEILAPMRAGMTATQWGTAVHLRMRNDFETLKEQYPTIYGDTFSELSFSSEGREIPYGTPSSSRLDMIERRKDVLCIYDIKTGQRGITFDQLRRARIIAAGHKATIVYFIEVRPSNGIWARASP